MSITGGYIARDGATVPTDRLRQHVERYRIMPSDARSQFITEVRPYRFGHLISKYQADYRHRTPTVVDDAGSILMTSGYLLPEGQDETYEDLLAAAVETDGTALENCEGEFVCVLVEGASGVLHIVNDRFAACPFYLLHGGPRTFFSSNLAFLAHLAGAGLDSDVLGWLQIFACDHTLGSRTHLRDVMRLTPASHLALSPTGDRVKRYWHLKHEVDEAADPTETATRVFTAFHAAARQRAERLGKGIIALSGGLDSRLLAGALSDHQGFTAFTFVDSMRDADTPDTRVAAEVATVLGLRHTVKPIPRGAWSNEMARDIVALTGGLIPLHHSLKTMQCIAAIREEGLDCQMGAGPGDSLAGSRVPAPEYTDPSQADACITAFIARRLKTAEAAARVLRDDVFREYSARLPASIRETFEQLDGATAAHRVSAWAMWYRQSAFTFMCPTHSHPHVTEAQPHLGYAYTELMLRLRADWLYKKTFYKFMIFHSLPSLRDVVYANTGERLTGRLVEVSPPTPQARHSLHSRLRSGVGRMLRPRDSSRGRNGGFVDGLLTANPEVLDFVLEMVHSGGNVTDILDRDKCGDFIRDYRAGRIQGTSAEDDAVVISKLATMCYVSEFIAKPEQGGSMFASQRSDCAAG